MLKFDKNLYLKGSITVHRTVASHVQMHFIKKFYDSAVMQKVALKSFLNALKHLYVQDSFYSLINFRSG